MTHAGHATRIAAAPALPQVAPWHPTLELNRMRNAVRGFVAAWYLFGWISHVYLALNRPSMYASFGETALIPAF